MATTQTQPITSPINPNFSGVTANGEYALGTYNPRPLAQSYDASAISSPTNFNLPNTPVATPPPITNIQDILNRPQSPQATDTKTSDLQSRYLAAISQSGTKAQSLAQEQINQGLPETQKQLADITGQIQQLQASTQQQVLGLQGEGKTAISSVGLQRQSAKIERENAIKALGLSAVAQTLQGKIALGQQLAQQAVDAKFAPIQQELDYTKAALEMNYENLNRSEKKRADETKLLLDERQRQLDQQKSDTQTILGFMAEASKNGAPALLISRAQQVSSPKEALSILGSYMSDPLGKQQALANLDRTRAQTLEAYSNMQLKKDELAQKLAQQAQNTVVDPVTGKPTSELKLNARDSAMALLEKFNKGEGTSAVGGSRIFGLQNIPGTAPKDFEIQFNNLKSLLSLDNIKLLKGQGQVSDAERKLLADASAKLDLAQSGTEFKKSLIGVTLGLGGSANITLTDKNGDSAVRLMNANDIEMAKKDGLKVTY